MTNVRGGDHFDGRRFFNPSGPAVLPFTKVPRLLLERKTRWPDRVETPASKPPPLDGSTAVVTFVGHSTFLIQTAAGNILTDPMYSERAGPWNLLGPRRVRPPAVPLDDLPPVSVVLLSHGHYDHLDVPTLRRLARRFDPLVIAPLGHEPLIRSTGIRRVETLDWWQEAAAAPVPVTLTPAHHFSARTPFDRNRALWGGFVVRVGDRRIYFAGDTAYAPFFGLIRVRLGPIDLALLPIGAYEPRWFMHAVHMNPAEAVQAHLDLEAAESIGMHFGTFQLTTEGIDDPVRGLEAALRARNVPPSRFRTIGFGQSVRLNPGDQSSQNPGVRP
ncbi:MAG TPA: MBL fold metallo-hydrolase [Vicinamibacterales bacterium]